jgi:hypothetical protein
MDPLEFHNKIADECGLGLASGFSEQGRRLRFDIIRRYLEQIPAFPRLKIVDYGCCDCKFFSLLNDRKGVIMLGLKDQPTVLGIDVNPRFTRYARRIWQDSVRAGHLQLQTGTIFDKKVQKAIERFEPDVICASGVFCLRSQASDFKDMIRLLFDFSELFIFNVLTADNPKPKKTEGIVRWKASEVLKTMDYCDCHAWEINRAYAHNDMTVVMRQHWTHTHP